MKPASPKLPLTPEERSSLRSAKIKVNQIFQTDLEILAKALHSSSDRTEYLRGLAIFQSIPSIGPKLAHLVIDLGYCSFEAVKQETGVGLTDRVEKYHGYWMDPCVEDSLRCIVHHANHPSSDKKWFDFTEERKEYRKWHGYPASRPKLAWYEAERSKL